MRNMNVNGAVTVLLVLCYNFSPAASSAGDRSPYYENCVKQCFKRNCTEGQTGYYHEFTEKAAEKQDPWAKMVGWNCEKECGYHCMWRTVHAYEERGFRIPKFHGKWPFKRILGMQEPMSVLASALNLASHTYMYSKLMRDERFSINNTPLLFFWHFFFVVCANGWVWSILFHTRETGLTEFMDYACALSIVMVHFAAAVVRLLYRKRKVAALVLILMLVYYEEHVRYLYYEDVDYEYHMTVNVTSGMIATALWMLFALGALCHAGGGGTKGQMARRYVWRLVVFCKLTGLAVLLELFDFPPYMWMLDAHALWHFCTAPLPLLFYRFVIDDLDYLRTASHQKLEKKTDEKLS